jgi:inosine-uridine nucleoside N-ribohydrolase
MSRNAFVFVALVAFGSWAAAAPPDDAARPHVVIDADTANEVDDPYAIVRALVEPDLRVVGLSSAQWQASHWATPTTLEDSQRLNEVLAGYLGRGDLPLPRGAHVRLFDWGPDLARHSAAATFLIDKARATPPGEKLTVVVLGASTNLASALLIAPDIAPRLRAYLLGTTYDFERAVWRKLDFNCMMDPRAIHVVLDAEGLETHVMPVNVAQALEFRMEEIRERFRGRSALLDFLVERWERHADGGRRSRVIWDLALVEALVRRDLAESIEVATPPENTARRVRVYRRIDAAAMKADFFRALGV